MFSLGRFALLRYKTPNSPNFSLQYFVHQSAFMWMLCAWEQVCVNPCEWKKGKDE